MRGPEVASVLHDVVRYYSETNPENSLKIIVPNEDRMRPYLTERMIMKSQQFFSDLSKNFERMRQARNMSNLDLIQEISEAAEHGTFASLCLAIIPTDAETLLLNYKKFHRFTLISNLVKWIIIPLIIVAIGCLVSLLFDKSFLYEIGTAFGIGCGLASKFSINVFPEAYAYFECIPEASDSTTVDAVIRRLETFPPSRQTSTEWAKFIANIAAIKVLRGETVKQPYYQTIFCS